MNTPVPAQQDVEPRRSLGWRQLPGPRARRSRWISWHYSRGDREETSCTACCLGRGYLFRRFAAAGPEEVRRFANAADLLNRHASIERQLFAAGWHLVRFTHHLTDIPRAPVLAAPEFTVTSHRR